MSVQDIIEKYIAFFEKRGHVRIANSSLVPQNDPTTLFTSSGMQPLLPFLLGEKHPQGKRLVNVQNCFRAVDIEEIGDNRHTTFFRMFGNWSLGDYFKKEQLPWFFEFLTDETTGFGLDPHKLHFTVFQGYKEFSEDEESYNIWENILREKTTIKNIENHIHYYNADKNWWSRAGNPDQMPVGEIGGPTSEVFYDFSDPAIHEKSSWKDQKCHVNCDCGRYIEIGNSVFMTYKKETDGSFSPLPNKNVDFGGGIERLLAAVENQQDVFKTSLLAPTIEVIEKITAASYESNKRAMRIITDHFGAAMFIVQAGIVPSKSEQGYVLRRLIRRALDNLNLLQSHDFIPIIETIAGQYKESNSEIVTDFEKINLVISEEAEKYTTTRRQANNFIENKYKNVPQTANDVKEISGDDAFLLYTTHGLSPTQIRSLGYAFDEQTFAIKMEEHQNMSRKGAERKFTGGLADYSEKTVMGHTATHLLHQALRDVLGSQVHQTGSNITVDRVRFDFNFDRKLSDEEIEKITAIVNEKIAANLPVHFEMMLLDNAKKIGAIGLFDEKYEDLVKVYFIGDYSKEFCGGPHVDFTSKVKSFTIIKQENIGHGQRRIYAKIG